MEKFNELEIFAQFVATEKGKFQLIVDVDWNNVDTENEVNIQVSSPNENNVAFVDMKHAKDQFYMMDKPLLEWRILSSVQKFLSEYRRELWMLFEEDTKTTI